MLSSSRCYFITGLFLLLSVFASAQGIIQSKIYPQNYFRYPLDLPPATAGTFAELRGAHFHSGLDFKTNQRTGFPVHAVFDGYIARVRVQYGGFGQAIYVTHPNGYQSVYGHIERFLPAVAQYIRNYQYQLQTYEADINLPPNLFPVCKNDVIAWSGNEGASAGPHVHFELRDTLTQETINPQLFGLTIPDKIPPAITAIGIYHLNGSPFSEKTPKEFLAVTGSGGNYRLLRPHVLNLSGNTGFGIAVTDMNSSSANRNGIYSLELKLDGRTVYTFAAERFAFDQTHALNAYIDYPAFITSHRLIQKCFILPGSHVSLYPQSINRGIISLNDDALHEVEYVVKDVAGNIATLTLQVKSGTTAGAVPQEKPAGNLFRYNKKNDFNTPQFKIQIAPGNLYDDLDFIYSVQPFKPGTSSVTHRVHNKFTPIHDAFDIWIKPDISLGVNAGKAVIVNTASGSIGGEYEGGYVKAQAHAFGDFYVKLDTVAPVITALNISNGKNMKAAKAIYLRAGDNLSGIKSFAGKIDGKWVLVEHNFKTKGFNYTFTDNMAPGKHTFEFTASDLKDNVATFTAEFYR